MIVLPFVDAGAIKPYRREQGQPPNNWGYFLVDSAVPYDQMCIFGQKVIQVKGQ